MSSLTSAETMSVTEDVIRDLLPLYFEGEASAGSRTLVEDWFTKYPAFAYAAKNGAKAIDALGSLKMPPLDQAGVQAALKRVRRITLLREVTHGLAMALTVIPLLLLAVDMIFPAQMPLELHGKLYLCMALFFALATPIWAIYIYARRRVQAVIFG